MQTTIYSDRFAHSSSDRYSHKTCSIVLEETKLSIKWNASEKTPLHANSNLPVVVELFSWLDYLVVSCEPSSEPSIAVVDRMW